MPNENRNIYFTENEVKIALMQFSSRKGLSFKVENINEFNLSSGDNIGITLTVFDATVNKAGTVRYNQAEIAAALMAYCMFLKIPLPKAGKKSVQVKNGDLLLNIKIQS